MSLVSELREKAGGHRRLRLQAADEIEILRATLLQQACLIPGDILREALAEQADSDGGGQET